MGSHELPDRSRRLLASLVRQYVESGEPVPSQVLARTSGLGVSSATVRNMLAQLEEAGYVQCLKEFAGRTPRTTYRLTASGRRAFDRYLAHLEALITAMKKR